MAETEKFVFMCGAAAQSEHSSSRKAPARMSGKAQFGVFRGGCCCCWAFVKVEWKWRERQNKHLIDLFGSVSASGDEIEYIDVAAYGNKQMGSGRCLTGSHSWSQTIKQQKASCNYFRWAVISFLSYDFNSCRPSKIIKIFCVHVEVTKKHFTQLLVSGHWVLRVCWL